MRSVTTYVLDLARAFGEGEVVVQGIAAARLHERAVERVGQVVDDLGAIERRIVGGPAAPAQHAAREPGVAVDVVEAALAHLAPRAGRRVDARHAAQHDSWPGRRSEHALPAVPVPREDHVLALAGRAARHGRRAARPPRATSSAARGLQPARRKEARRRPRAAAGRADQTRGIGRGVGSWHFRRAEPTSLQPRRESPSRSRRFRQGPCTVPHRGQFGRFSCSELMKPRRRSR